MGRYVLTLSISLMLIGAFWLSADILNSIVITNQNAIYMNKEVEIISEEVPLGLNLGIDSDSDSKDEKIEISIEDEKIPEGLFILENKFNDIDNHWAKESILEMVSRGIMSGINEDTFAPNQNISKAMFITLLGRIRNQIDDESKNRFVDVAEDKYYAKYVTWADRNGLLLNTSGNKFNPNVEITREEIAYAVSNYLQNVEDVLVIRGSLYDDDKLLSDKVSDSIYFLKGMDIMFGKKENKFMPKEKMTRAECAALISRIIDKLQIK